MREIVVISGKGGTGKTSVCASLAHLAQNKVVCDLDVDAPDMHILLESAGPHPRGVRLRQRSRHRQGCLPPLRDLFRALPF